MKKGIAIIFVIMVLFCIALAGCGQNNIADIESKPGYIFNTEDHNTMDRTGNPGITDTVETDAPSSVVDNFHPKQDASGFYIFNVKGHEIKLKTDLWKYIGDSVIDGETVHDFFFLASVAKHLGYDKPYNLDGRYKKTFDDGSYAVGGFQYDSSARTSSISSCMIDSNKNVIGSGSLFIEPYNFSVMTYQYNVGYYVSLDMIILCVYSMEYYADGTGGDCWTEIFGEKLPRIAP